MATADAMNPFAIQPIRAVRGASPLREWSAIVAMVLFAHVLIMWFWASSPRLSRTVRHDMSVSISVQSPTQAVEARPEVKPVPVEPRQAQDTTLAAPKETAAPPAVESSASAQPADASPGLPDREPDYHAAYLNNPKPPYPMAARRMGWQGKVVLDVEVLASGLPGQIMLHQSSGHEALDNAALNTVRSWRFMPARHNGEAVTRRFLVPIPFILKEDQ